MKIRDKFGCRDHEIVEIRILRGWNKAKSRTTTLEFWRSEFVLFRALEESRGRQPWRGVHETWLTFKYHLLQTQKWSMQTGRSQAKRAGGLHG